MGGIPRARWQLESGGAPHSSGELEQSLLHCEVSNVRGFSLLAERPRECNCDRSTEGQPDRYPEVQWNTAAEAPLDLADPRLIDPGLGSENVLRHASCLAGGTNRLTK